MVAMGLSVQASTPGQTTLKKRNPALDGYRGAALLGMMAWHAEIAAVRGGFARMTIFFVLAGFLATLSYNRAWRDGSRGAYRRFWAGRARRLLPVTLLGVGLSIAYTRIWGPREMVNALPGDVLAVFTYSFNWRSIAADRRYAELHAEQFSFQHYWTLSLEEQCFIALPLVLGIAGHARRRHRFGGAAVLAGIAVLLGFLPIITEPAPDTAYFGTHVRGAEFLVGVLGAMWLTSRRGSTTDFASSSLLRVLGFVSLVFLAAVMILVDRDQLWLYRGGMFLFAFPAVWLLLTTLDPRSQAHRLLAWRPLALLGRWAFPIYVLHWPIFQWFDHQLDAPRTIELIGMFTSAIAIGALVHYRFERPLMEAARSPQARRHPHQWVVADRPLFGLIAAGTAIALVVAILPVSRDDGILDLATVAAETRERRAEEVDSRLETNAREVLSDEELAALGTLSDLRQQFSDDWALAAALGNLSAVDLDPERARTVLAEGGRHDPLPDTGSRSDGRNRRFGLYGGSSALAFGSNFDDAVESDVLDMGAGYADLGCGLLVDVERKDAGPDQRQLPGSEHCNDWPSLWPASAKLSRLEIAVLMTGVWDTYDVRPFGAEEWQSVLDPAIGDALRRDIERARDLWADVGVELIVLVTTPLVTDGVDGDARAERNLPEDHDKRVARYNQLLEEVAAEHRDVVLVDYAGYIARLTDEERNSRLYDGVHPTIASADLILNEFLAKEIESSTLACTTCSWNN